MNPSANFKFKNLENDKMIKYKVRFVDTPIMEHSVSNKSISVSKLVIFLQNCNEIEFEQAFNKVIAWRDFSADFVQLQRVRLL